jgi:hypothetical protein
MYDGLCPNCFKHLKSNTFTLVCQKCRQKWKIEWIDGVYQLTEIKNKRIK